MKNKNKNSLPASGSSATVGAANNSSSPVVAWEQYEAGRDYKRRVDYYAHAAENERFYRGDQWTGIKTNGLPTPIFNVVRQIVSYLVNAVMSYKLGIVYSDEALAFTPASEQKRKIEGYLKLLNDYASYRFEKEGMNQVLRGALLDAALTGDGVLYTYWESGKNIGQVASGDFKTVVVDATNLYAADMNRADIQSQDWIMIAGRESVHALRDEARRYGASEETARLIIPDTDGYDASGDLYKEENSAVGTEKATYLIKFYRNAQGRVAWEKSTRSAVISGAQTGMTLYPVAYFNWDRTAGSFHGTSPVTALIQNQKYINRTFAMVMKHMTDTAFSKVIYDKRLIPEWSNEVGQAIGVMTGGDITNVATTLGVGEMEEDILKVIEMTVKLTKDLSGATEVALGEADPKNTSAILALREASEVPLEGVKEALRSCVEQTADIWVQMMCEYYVDGRLVAFAGEDGISSSEIDFNLLRGEPITAKADVGVGKRFSQSTLLTTLDKLLATGHISFAQYLERLPDGIISDRQKLLSEVLEHEKKKGGEL